MNRISECRAKDVPEGWLRDADLCADLCDFLVDAG